MFHTFRNSQLPKAGAILVGTFHKKEVFLVLCALQATKHNIVTASKSLAKTTYSHTNRLRILNFRKT